MNKKTSNPQALNFTIGLKNRLLLFLCITVLFFIIGSLLAGFLIHLKGANTMMMRISAIVQDLIVFILPAIATALVITRLPANFLALTERPLWSDIWFPALILICSIPFMNFIIEWNNSISLPESMSCIENWMRESEQAAQQSIAIMMGDNTIVNLIMNILIIGIFAGFSEELFFRGAFQRLLTTGRINHHVAIWIVAFVFSASHFQFYGFFGRLLLGAYFGYLLYWTRCLWIPIIIHILNNTLYLIGNFFSTSYLDLNKIGTDNALNIVSSVLLTALGIYIFTSRRSSKPNIGH